MPTAKPRFIVTVDDDTLERIEDFQYDNRYPNRNIAVNALIKEGLKTYYLEKPDLRYKRKRRKTDA